MAYRRGCLRHSSFYSNSTRRGLAGEATLRLVLLIIILSIFAGYMLVSMSQFNWSDENPSLVNMAARHYEQFMSATNSTIQTSNSSYASVGQNWDGYEAQCYQQRFFINHSCFNDSSSSTSIFGASDTISVPTVSTPSVSGVNGNNCCWLGEWVGVGTSFHTSDGTLIQAGIAKAVDGFWCGSTCEYFATSVVPPSGLTVSCNGVTIPQNWFAPINC